METEHRQPGLVHETRNGSDGALDGLFPAVYAELRAVARRQLQRKGPEQTLGTTALVHEAYLKLAGASQLQWADRTHFFGVAARAMRQVVVDYARRHSAAKRGGSWKRVPLDDGDLGIDSQAETLLALDEALTRLAGIDERLSRVVECQFFAGMTDEEIAAALEITTRTVRRDWVKARLWLYDHLYGGAQDGIGASVDTRA